MARRHDRQAPQRFSEEETKAALAQFNAGVARAEDERREQRAIAKAEKQRKDAADALKRVADSGGSEEERTAAEAHYRESLEEWGRLTAGDDPSAEDSVVAEPEPDVAEGARPDDGGPPEA